MNIEEYRRYSLRQAALRTAIIYSIFGLLWIKFSDMALEALITDTAVMTTVQTYKGWLFIVVTATLLYGLVLRSLKDLQRTQQSVRTVIDGMPSVVWGVDNKGCVLFWNEAAVRSLNKTNDELFGLELLSLYPTLGRHLENVHSVLQNGGEYRAERIGREGQSDIFDVLIYPMVWGEERGAVVRLDNVTERVQLEEMMIQNEKMMSVGGLAAGMAHEINNPLGGVLQGVQNVRRRLSSELGKNLDVANALGVDLKQVEQYLEQRGITHLLDGVHESGQRAADIVASMLEFARQSDSVLADVDIEQLLDRVISLVSNDFKLENCLNGQGVTYIRAYAGNLPDVPCVAIEIEQVVFNMLNNAVQAFADCVEGESPEITIRTSLVETMVRIDIRDNGPGMPEAIKKRVFEPFFTTKQVGHGTGLGLSVAYFIVTSNHHGSLSVSSEEGKGSTFTILLPLVRQ